MKRINDHGLTDEDLVIGVVPKEREMKVDPRLFTILTLTTRLYFVITESLIAEYLLDYFPQITMSFSGLELQKTLFNVTKFQQKGDSKNSGIQRKQTYEYRFSKMLPYDEGLVIKTTICRNGPFIGIYQLNSKNT